ncbi:unnamed protein product [Staurois parvus]|uniref:Uncharacterized protein n=1 Tax=Staurois parvus TaxID=386267 RepID=A0ABN9FZK8_9NEOB|nr:unnamed protein product [Staurois parvus]
MTSALSCDQLCPITADRIVAPSMPPVSAHQCHLSVPINVNTSAHQCTSMPHISDYQCTSMPTVSASQCCLSVLPISATYQCQSVPPISARQCYLTVPISAA